MPGFEFKIPFSDLVICTGFTSKMLKDSSFITRIEATRRYISKKKLKLAFHLAVRTWGDLEHQMNTQSSELA